MDNKGRDDSRAEYFHQRCDGWLTEGIFSKDRMRVAAAGSNLCRALRCDEGRLAALIAIGEYPYLTKHSLPRVWAARKAELLKIRARRNTSSVISPPKE
jgi:hypothetical protein